MKPLRIIYFGGLYHSEYSMLQSVRSHGGDIVFPIDDNFFGLKKYATDYNPQMKFVEVVPSSEIVKFIIRYKPDVIIHRHYIGDGLMHYGLYEDVKKMGIPYVKYESETDYYDNVSCQGINCDFLVYGHNTDGIKRRAENCGKPSSFLPFGVSSFEKMIPATRLLPVGTIGHHYEWRPKRIKNLKAWITAAQNIGQEIHVYGVDWLYKPLNSLVKHAGYYIDESTQIINNHKIIINVESMPDLDGAYSYKMWQSMACGVPTITGYKDSIKNLFGDNVIMISSEQEAAEQMDRLLKDDKYREDQGLRAYRFMHANFEWYDILHGTLKKLGAI